MNLGKDKGVGPALRVLRHYKQRRRSYQIRFPSGERAVVLVAGMPAPSVELVRFALGGVIPWQTVWEYNPMRAGGYGNYIQKLKAMFSPTTERSDDSVNYGRIREALLRCQSIEEARMQLLKRERLANNPSAEAADGFMRNEPGSVTSNESWDLEAPASQNGSADKTETSAISDRYRIKNDASGKVLTCVEAPNIIVRAKKGTAIPAKQARHARTGTIFLDGAAQGEPFVDFEKDIYNLDHHDGCIQSLASCEQAMLLIRKLRDLRRRDWVVMANDGELDTVFAIWVLLNHLRLNEGSALCAKVMPLLRLEGVIDAHGPDAEYVSALPPELLHSTSTILRQLRQQESVFKSYGRWSEIDLLEYIADRLRAVDEVIYSNEMFDELHEVDELAQAEIANGSIAVACRSQADINEVDRQLRRTYGERLGILIFQSASDTYGLRQIDRALPATLERAYERLNLLDPAVKGNSQNRWGGSPEIGASPRRSGTGLMPTQIVEAVREAFREPRLVDVIFEIPRAVFFALAAMLPAVALIFVGNLLRERGYIGGQTGVLAAFVLFITASILYGLKARRVSGLYGWRWPNGLGWLVAVPGAIVGALAGGVWSPGSLGYRIGSHNGDEFTASAVLLFPAAAELLFRGVILGNLAARLPMQRSGASWAGSWPTLISSLLYAAASVVLLVSFTSGQAQMSRLLVTTAAALLFGISSGMVRERSESIFSSLLLHSICSTALILSGGLPF